MSSVATDIDPGLETPAPEESSPEQDAEHEYVQRMRFFLALCDGYAGAESRCAWLFAAVWARRVYRALMALDYAESRLPSCPRPIAIGGHTYVVFRCAE